MLKRKNPLRDLLADIESVRAKLVDLRMERRHVERSPISQQEIGERVARIVEEREAEARALFAPEGLSRQDGVGFLDDGNLAAVERSNLIGALALLGLGDTVRQSLVAEATAASSGKSYSADQRSAELIRIDKDFATQERIEEALIRSLEDSGVTSMLRRPDANPAIFLLGET